MRRLVVIVVLLLAATSCGDGVPTPEDVARGIEGRVWSPYCPGRLLVDCTTQQARELRGRIEARLMAGESEAEVLDWIVANHGRDSLAAPAASGRGLLAWLVPLAALLAGVIGAVALVGRWSASGRRPPDRPDTDKPDSDTVRRIRDEVQRDL